MNGPTDQEAGIARRGFLDVLHDLQERFPQPDAILKEADKKEFVQLFGEYLKTEDILQNYDELWALKDFQTVDCENANAIEEFKNKHHLRK